MLKDKTAIVTGAGTGIGRAIAARLHAEGARVVLAGRRQDKLEETARLLGERTRVVPTDVTVPAQVQALADAAAGFGDGRIDILVNNAGVMRFAPLGQADEAHWQDDDGRQLLGPAAADGGSAAGHARRWRQHRQYRLHRRGARLSGRRGLWRRQARAAPHLAGAGDGRGRPRHPRERDLPRRGAGHGAARRRGAAGPAGAVPDTHLPTCTRWAATASRTTWPTRCCSSRSDQSRWITGAVLPLDGGRHLATNRPRLD